jgi:hypothetical protein
MPTLGANKIFRFKVGRVVEVAHESKGFGYLVASFQRPRFGSFFSLITKTYSVPIADEDLEELVHAPQTTISLNTYRLFGRDGPVEFRGRRDLASFVPSKAKFWFGPEVGPLTLEEADGSISYQRVSSSFQEVEIEMERRGYVHSVLWLPASVAEFLFDGRPLRWSAHKKY